MKRIVVAGGSALALALGLALAPAPAAAQTRVSIAVAFGVAQPYWPRYVVARHLRFFRPRPPIVVFEERRPYYARPLFVDRVRVTRGWIERRHGHHHHDCDYDDER
jgi:hypothetical protein